MKCPACENVLTPMTVGKLIVDVCVGECGGIWFDNFELHKVDEAQEFEGEELANVERNENLFIDYTRRRKCPKCDNTVMMRHFFSQQRHVQLDTCPNCNGVREPQHLVGRVTPCAPKMVYAMADGEHGVTRPTLRF